MRLVRINDTRSRRLVNLSHYLMGFALIMKGVDKAKHFHHHPVSVLLLFFAGAFIILGTVFHHPIEKKIKNFTALFHMAEGIALFFLSFIMLEKGVRIPFFLFFIGLVYLSIGIFEFFTGDKAKKDLMPGFLLIIGICFLAAALAAGIYNFLDENNAWMYFTTALLAAVGFGILLNRKRLRSEDS